MGEPEKRYALLIFPYRRLLWHMRRYRYKLKSYAAPGLGSADTRKESRPAAGGIGGCACVFRAWSE